jgi:farnesyl-diphosphate farnesyltransferase
MPRALPPDLTRLLEQTSRTFYKTLNFLPGSIRYQIGLAYLLARTTDTIADTEIVPVEQRLIALEQLRERIQGSSSAPLNAAELARQQGLPAERELLDRIEASLAELNHLSAQDLKLVRQVLDTITGGQELDLRRFAGASEKNIVALQTDSELDDYTYRVAGCVGKFWTEMCLEHEFSSMEILGLSELTAASLEELGIRFGKGLQLVNILRDLPVDLRKGRCYLPLEKLAEAALTPNALLEPANETKFRPIYDRYLDMAQAHLVAGWEYTTNIPWTHVRVRLACAWPILIGIETIARLRKENVLDPSRRVKISRADLKRIIVRSVLWYPWQPGWRRLGPILVSAGGKAVAPAKKMA